MITLLLVTSLMVSTVYLGLSFEAERVINQIFDDFKLEIK